MAHLTYTPEGMDEPALRLDADPDNYDSVALEAIEEATGWTAYEWAEQMARGSVKSIHALLWVGLRERTPDLEYAAVRFKMSEVDFVADPSDDDQGSEGEGPKDSPTGDAEPGTGDEQ